MALVGKFAFTTIDEEEGVWNIAEIVEKISDDLYLVDYEGGCHDGKCLVRAQDMAVKCEDGSYVWTFFETREAAQKYADWLGEDSPKVVKLV